MGRDGYSFFYWGIDDREKKDVSLPYIGMISLTMVVNSTNLIMKLDSDFRIMIL